MTASHRTLFVVGAAFMAAALVLAGINHVLVNAADQVLVDYGTPTTPTAPRAVP